MSRTWWFLTPSLGKALRLTEGCVTSSKSVTQRNDRVGFTPAVSTSTSGPVLKPVLIVKMISRCSVYTILRGEDRTFGHAKRESKVKTSMAFFPLLHGPRSSPPRAIHHNLEASQSKQGEKHKAEHQAPDPTGSAGREETTVQTLGPRTGHAGEVALSSSLVQTLQPGVSASSGFTFLSLKTQIRED